MSKVEQVEQGGGNTKTPPKKRCSQSKYWCFTFNNYTVEQMVHVFEDLKRKTDLFIFGEEVGESGTPHLQGYIEFAKRARPLEAFPGWGKKCHWEKRKGSRADNVTYCAKEGKNLKMSEGLKVPAKLHLIEWDDLRVDQQDIACMFEDPEDPKWGRKIYWFWEADGNWGKSILTTYMVDQMGAIEVGGKAADAKCGISAYLEKNKEGPPIVIMDVPRTKGAEYISYEAIESIKNGRFFSGKYESGMCRYNRPHFIVFANEPPETTRMSLDRWVIRELTALR